jgi:hypothetical protein
MAERGQTLPFPSKYFTVSYIPDHPTTPTLEDADFMTFSYSITTTVPHTVPPMEAN